MFIINPYVFGGAVFTGILDTYTGAKVAYSVRRLRGGYTGALVRIRRSSDNAEKDFYPDTNNELSLTSEDGSGTSLTTWISTNSGYVVTWYDQSGNGNNLTRPVAADQPRVVNGGALETDPNNGNVAVKFDGSSDFMNLGSTISVTQNYYHHFVFNRASSGIISTGLANTNATPYPMLWFSNDTVYSGTQTTTAHDSSQTATGDFIHTTLRDGSNNVKMWVNGVAKTTQTNTGSTLSFELAFNRNGFLHSGFVQELIFWDTDQESNQSGIEGDANSYFTVF